MNTKYIYRLLSISAVIVGFFIAPAKSKSFDNWIYFSRSLLTIGLMLLASYLWRLSQKVRSPEFVICPRCNTPQYAKDLVDGHCAKCAGDIEQIEGYYERHPEMKNRKD